MMNEIEENKFVDGNYWKIIYNDGDKIRAIKGRILSINQEFLHLDTGIKEIFLPKKFLVRIEGIQNEQEGGYP